MTRQYTDVNAVVGGYLRDLAVAQSSQQKTAIAHARLAAIPAERIVNCWPLDRLLVWLSDPSSERST